MTFDFFEGAAGTGKTHCLVGRAAELVEGGLLGEDQHLLALTFMNGARRRLDARLGATQAFRRRFECQTFDSFARMLTARRRSLISASLEQQSQALGDFDGPCFAAAALLEVPSVREWVARKFPLIAVDEAQDLDEHRLRILQALSQSCSVLVGADAFQCLSDGRDTTALMAWLTEAGQVHRLTKPQRTNRQGLLNVASAIREGADVRSVLIAKTFKNKTTWSAAGFRLVESPATKKNPALLAWTIADEIDRGHGPFAILTPDATNPVLRAALESAQTREWKRKSGVTFGPVRHSWDRHEAEEADALVAAIGFPDEATYADLQAVLSPLSDNAAVAQVLGRMDRLRRTQGVDVMGVDQVRDFVRDAIRNQARAGLRRRRGHLVMTIHRAKNREFKNVVVLWPHSVTGTSEHLRRLLYNGVTRATDHCTVVALGQDRLDAPPFAPSGN